MKQTIAARAAKFEGLRLTGVARLADVCPDFGSLTLLHAGPPLEPGNIPLPVVNAAIGAVLFEGMATSQEEARSLIAEGAFDFQPAQDWGVYTPLAQVVSVSMPLFVVSNGEHAAYAPLVEGPPPALRFGSADSACVSRLHHHAHLAFNELQKCLAANAVELESIVKEALIAGNECHTLTDKANAAMLRQFSGLSREYQSLLDASPGFVLPVLMAACGWRLRHGAGPIAAAGGNGEQFGVRLRHSGQWQCAAAMPPTGHPFAGLENEAVLGAIGDSAVIDFCGLGGQELASAPELAESWADLLPEDWAERPNLLLDDASGVICPKKVLDQRMTPIVNLAMVPAGGSGAIVGKGFYQPDLALFESLLAGDLS